LKQKSAKPSTFPLATRSASGAIEVLTNNPVVLVLLLILADWHIYCQRFHFDFRRTPEIAGRQLHSVNIWVEICAFTVIVGMILWSYFATIVTSSQVRHNSPDPDEISNAALSKLHICVRCAERKPLRAHHCSTCKTCVLKMDHHCPWVANCVGLKNYKYFILFVFYAWMGCTLFTIHAVKILRTLSRSEIEDAEPHFVEIVCSLITAIFAFTLTFFMCFHVYLIAIGKTTLEFMKLKKPSPYSHDTIIKNFEEVFGPVSFYWFVPMRNPKAPMPSGWSYQKHEEKEKDPEDGLMLAELPTANVNADRESACIHRRQGPVELV